MNFSDILGTKWKPNGSQNGAQMWPKIDQRRCPTTQSVPRGILGSPWEPLGTPGNAQIYEKYSFFDFPTTQKKLRSVGPFWGFLAPPIWIRAKFFLDPKRGPGDHLLVIFGSKLAIRILRSCFWCFLPRARAKGSCCLGLPLRVWIELDPMPGNRKK